MKNTVSFFAALFFMAFADTALAYRIYNDSDIEKIEAWGEHCPKCFHGTITSGKSKACPGNETGCKNKTEITAIVIAGPGQPGSWDYKCRKCTAKVPAHGWVKFLSGPYGATQCLVYDEKGSVLNAGKPLMEDAPGGC